LIDLAPMDEMPADEQERVLLRELGQYQPELLERPLVTVGTKIDVATAETKSAWSGLVMSAVTGEGVRPVLGELARRVAEARSLVKTVPSTVVLRPVPEGTQVEKLAVNEFRLHGREVMRAVALNDVTTPDALNYIEERLKHLGVLRLLAKAGAVEGATVHIGEFSFDYVPEAS